MESSDNFHRRRKQRRYFCKMFPDMGYRFPCWKRLEASTGLSKGAQKEQQTKGTGWNAGTTTFQRFLPKYRSCSFGNTKGCVALNNWEPNFPVEKAAYRPETRFPLPFHPRPIDYYGIPLIRDLELSSRPRLGTWYVANSVYSIEYFTWKRTKTETFYLLSRLYFSL